MKTVNRTFLLLILVVCSYSWALCTPKDSTWSMKGFDFMIGGGIYFGNKYNASYYNGSPLNENGINYVFKNRYWRDEIYLLMQENIPYNIGDSIWVGELPGNMSYNPSMAINLGVRYKFGKNWGISLSYTFARLTAKDFFSMRFNAPTGNEFNDYVLYPIIGKENRSLIELTASYLFHPHEIVKPFIEIGAQFNFVRVKSLDIFIEGQPYTLLDQYGGAGYIPGSQMLNYDTQYGGAGFGLCANVGIKFAFNKYVSIDPTFCVSASSIGLNGYKNFAFNYAAMIRIVMNDAVFSR